jgi:inward rectifier potassium channel
MTPAPANAAPSPVRTANEPLSGAADRVTPASEERDLGFGAVVASQSRRRLLNRDGSFNVAREGMGLVDRLNPYHSLITMSWPRFLALMASTYIALNLLFAAAYLACGPDALLGGTSDMPRGGLLQAFFFSVHTFATIGYGTIAPHTIAANIVVTLESLVGLLSVAIATGLIFSRFSRPQAKIRFSEHALIAPYRGGRAFEFRIANGRGSQVIELRAQVMFSRLELRDGTRSRQFYPLELERQRVVFFPLSWTIVHPIDERSPLNGLSSAMLTETEAEFLVLLSGIDETFSEPVHTRTSYRSDEVVWDARFSSVFREQQPGEPIAIDVTKLDRYERV